MAAPPALLNAGDWRNLLTRIEKRRVIPIIGAELLTLTKDGTSIPLYRAVAERLLADEGGLSADVGFGGVSLREYFELNDAVCALAARGCRIKDLYFSVHNILQDLLQGSEPPVPLCQLASITHFDLFVATTPDDLLARALDTVRFDGSHLTDQIEYAPKLPTDRRRDIPASRPQRYTAVFYLFGKSDVNPFYAIHDEDALEFPYILQNSGQPERMLSELRSRDLLLIGCTFADWLSRFFLRLSNSERLFSDQRTKKEFLIGEEAASDRNFTVFLERFVSRDTRCYQMDSCAFVTELYHRWRERNPMPNQPDVQMPSTSERDIFISYAKEDFIAAQRLHEDLQAMGGDVAWFDKTQIHPGANWGPETRAAIKKCSLFLPLISATTEERDEGWFRREWDEALERARGMHHERKFIIPVIIDEGYLRDAHLYRRVPESFLSYQYAHAPGGRMSEGLKGEIQNQLRALERGRER